MNDSITTLKKAIPYIRLYKGKTFVVKVGGKILQRADVLDALAEDISLLYQVGIRVVIVHGGGPQATEMSRKLGIEPRIVDGRRITDEKTLEVAKMVYAGTLNIDILSSLRRHGTPAVGISGVDGNLITARRRKKQTVDYGLVGDIEKVDPGFLDHLLSGGQVPVVSSLACDPQGKIFNVNADSIAQALAGALSAEKLLFLTDTDGILANQEDPSSLISYTDIEEIERFKENGHISGGMLPKVDACIRALKEGVRRTHVLNGARPGGLLTEIFTNAGCGTMIVDSRERQNYQQAELGG